MKHLGRLACCLLLCAPAGPLSAATQRDWYTLSIDGQRVGYAWHEVRNTTAERIDSQVMRVQVSQLRRTALVETTIEVGRATSGAPEWIRVHTVNGIDRNGWRGTVASDGRSLEVTTSGTGGKVRVALPPDLLWPDQLAGALPKFAAAMGTRSRFRMLDTSSATVAEAEAERVSGAATPDDMFIRVTSTAPGNAPRVESFWIDAQSRLARRERRFFAVPLRWETCARNCDAHVEKPYDLMARMVVASPYRIPQQAFAGPIRYVIARADGNAPRLPVTGEQAVVADGSRAVVTICNSCGEQLPLTDAERRIYLAANPWVRADAPEVQGFARLHGGRGPPRQVMTALVDAVRRHMTGDVDYLGYGTAVEALQSRSGDCTEFSVLLAAAARAQGIPARLVAGLVYAARFSGKKDVFSPHVWVQAWTGDRWVSYDAGLERFDATHIALAVGDGDPRRMDVDAGASGQWRIEKLGLLK